MTAQKTSAQGNDVINRIAKEILDLETLETRRWDRLDFHELAVWQIREALQAAYQAGLAAAGSRVKQTNK